MSRVEADAGQADGTDELRLVLSTWFSLGLRGEPPGGLPNDFLTRGANCLLLFDQIVCDASALDAELRFEGRWLSADILRVLKDEGVLIPRDLVADVPEQFWAMLSETGISDAVARRNDEALAALRRAEPSNTLRGLDVSFREVNRLAFAAIHLQNIVRYDWRDYYLGVSMAPVVFHGDRDLGSEVSSGNMSAHGDEVSTLLTHVLPEVPLIPLLPNGTDARRALDEALQAEHSMLFRWMYGDPQVSREVYHSFRLGEQFRRLDRRIDGPRAAQAWRNLELILDVRRSTADVRAGMQKLIQSVSSGELTAAEAQAELSIQRAELLSRLPGSSRVALDLVAAGAGFAAGLAATVASSVGLVDPGVVPWGPAFAAYRLWRSWESQQALRSSRQEFPAVWLVRDLRSEQDREWRRTTPRRHRTR